jgi:hypothetical protein
MNLRNTQHERVWPVTRRTLTSLTGLLVLPAFSGCVSEGFLSLHGTVVSAADRQPIPGADVEIYVTGEDLTQRSCEDLQKDRTKYAGRSDQQGRFKTKTYTYAAFGNCEPVILCVSRSGFESFRKPFDTCDQDWAHREQDVVIELKPL